MGQRIKIRRDTSANWTSKNPVLADGEQGYDTTLKLRKTGDGVAAWNALQFDYAKGTLVEGVGTGYASYAVSSYFGVSHGLGVIPDIVKFDLKVVNPFSGYSIGDIIYSVVANAPTLNADAGVLYFSTTAALPTVSPKTGGAPVAILAANVKIGVRCWSIK